MATHVLTAGRTIHWAHLYEAATAIFGWPVYRLHLAMLARAAIQRGERVLDAGCGPGRLARRAALAADATGQVIGIDASPEMIALATRRGIAAGWPVKFEAAPIEAMPLADATFDVALASLVLHHLPPELQPRAIGELFRVLRPGGRLVIGEFASEPGQRWGHLASLFRLQRGQAHASKLVALLREAGFESIVVMMSGRSFCTIAARRPAVRSSSPLPPPA